MLQRSRQDKVAYGGGTMKLMSVERLPDWGIPPQEGFVAEDLDRLPGLPPPTEMIDGSLVFVSPQALFHMSMITLLQHALRIAAPAQFKVRREMTVPLGARQRPEPDLMITRKAGDRGRDQPSYLPQGVVLAIEVVSPESRERDMERKPSLYANAGIPHFWLIENLDPKVVVHVHELVPETLTYKLTGSYHDRLELSVPFPIDIDLTKIDEF